MRGKSDEARSRGKSSSLPSHRRHGIRHQPARRHQARRLSHPRGADRMDGSSRLKSHAVPFLADDVPFRRAHPADLLAVLQMVASVAPAGRLDLQKTPRAATIAGTGFGKTRIANGGWENRFSDSRSIFYLPSSIFAFPFTPHVNHAQTRNSSRLNAPSVCSTTSSRPGKWFSISGNAKP